MRSSQSTLIAASIALALIVGTGGASSAIAPRAKSAVAPDAASNEAAAKSDATALLASLTLPAGATPSASEPSGDGFHLAQPAETIGTPNLVVDHAWWTVAGTPHSVRAYVVAHLPPGSKYGGGTVGDPTGVAAFDQLAWPAITGVLGERMLIVEVVALADGSTGVRADAEVAWMTPRPPSEVVPESAKRLGISVSHLLRHPSAARAFLVTSPSKIRRVVALLNALPLLQPGAYFCPLDRGTRIRLEFYSRRRATPIAVAIVNAGGCQPVALTLSGRPQPTLTGSPIPGSGLSPGFSLAGQLGQVLGRTLG